MRGSVLSPLIVLVMSTVLISGLGVTSSVEESGTQVSGKMTMAQVKLETMTVGDAEGHTLLFSQSEGTNTSTGKQAFVDGAKVTNMSFSDMVKGSGANQGYCVVATDKGSAYTKWNAVTTTVMSSEGTPAVTFLGEFKWIKGTGDFEGIGGSGVFKGSWTSETTYEFEWEGIYTIGK